ncbi:E3 ubiquitin-protein ligase RNF182 [Rhinichthys klamathensis goyatoka]|uniref:E3 ubiquitin-protein ligase RNF182 n=1 Tax=Rhinichthys klamathensis goyatoka TaxID=3034132 RepID=UPI0024B5047E|nr:E3 ubiquitin-protein ligase RNF182 [Rhinichthys klamathensis goyatoka]
MMGQLPEDVEGCFTTEELECKICYCAYSLSSRRPKVLECCHCLCAKCLAKILDLGESSPNAVVCPFCRYITDLPREAVDSLPDEYNLVSALLSVQARKHPHPNETQGEILLSPRCLNSLVGHSASASPTSIRSNYVVITIMEPRQESAIPAPGRDYRSSSLDSMASVTNRWTVWNCAALLCQTSARVLVWLLGLLYFSSLPLGVYLLIMQHTTTGVLMVSLVPVSLLIVMVYGLCQCLCREFWECVPP